MRCVVTRLQTLHLPGACAAAASSMPCSAMLQALLIAMADSYVLSHDRSAAYDYGSPEANRAVEKLTKMGCIVHPPGSSEAADWGALAGVSLTGKCCQMPSLDPSHYVQCTAASNISRWP